MALTGSQGAEAPARGPWAEAPLKPPQGGTSGVRQLVPRVLAPQVLHKPLRGGPGVPRAQRATQLRGRLGWRRHRRPAQGGRPNGGARQSRLAGATGLRGCCP